MNHLSLRGAAELVHWLWQELLADLVVAGAIGLLICWRGH